MPTQWSACMVPRSSTPHTTTQHHTTHQRGWKQSRALQHHSATAPHSSVTGTKSGTTTQHHTAAWLRNWLERSRALQHSTTAPHSSVAGTKSGTTAQHHNAAWSRNWLERSRALSGPDLPAQRSTHCGGRAAETSARGSPATCSCSAWQAGRRW